MSESKLQWGEKKVKYSNNTGELLGFQVYDFQYSTLGKLILHRLFRNRDIKILITSSGNTTGTGKTMLAIILSKLITMYSNEIFENDTQWTAEENSFMNVYEYLEKYQNGERGEVLITDELEYLADKRRSMTHENVHFSQAWQMLRYKNIISIGTAPSMANLDIRIPENTDIWINIVYPGYAAVYYVSMDDFTGEIEFQRLKQFGYIETIRWNPIDDNKDYQILTQKKKDIGIPGMGKDKRIDKDTLEKEKEKVESQTIREITIDLLKQKQNGNVSLSQNDIGDIVNRSQQYISKVKREEL
ncbi:MAG: ATP-binding protein [Promethearchaeia archaeon]